MLYITCVELQFCIHYVQLPFEKKWLPEISKGGQDSGKAPQMKPWYHYIVGQLAL